MGILRTDKVSGLEKEKRQNPNLVVNGDFSDSSIAGWTAYNAVASYDSGAGGRIKVDDSASAGGWSNAAYVINTEPGASYRFEVRASATDSDTQFVGYYQGTYDTAGTAPTVYSSEITVNPSVHYFDLIATGSTVTLLLIANGSGVVYFDDISFRKTDGNSIGGSVHFDGNDHLSIGNSGDFNFLHNGATDWTAEFWAKMPSVTRGQVFGTGASSAQTGFSLTLMSAADNQSDEPGVFAMFGRGAAGNYRYWGVSNGLSINTWHHIAAVFKSSDKTLALYIDGREVDNDSGTENGTFGSGNYSTSNSSYAFIVGKNTHSSTFFKGYISNLRVVAGRRLYTSDFTPPVHALEPINGTRILCCNNPDSVTAVDSALIGTAHINTSSGNPQNSTKNPGFTRDFTYGTEFRGVTTFDTQGYFVPPSGTTEQRGRGRGFFAGGGTTPNYTNAIDFITISSSGNAQDFGDLTQEKQSLGGTANSTRGIFASGYNTPVFPATGNNTDRIEYITTATTGNALDFGNLDSAIRYASCAANSTRGLIAGGYYPSYIDRIEYITIASLGDAQTFGTLTASATATDKAGLSSPTRALFAGGENGSGNMTLTDYVTIASTGNAQDFGDLTAARRRAASASSGTRGLVANGYNGSAYVNTIDYVTIASTGNAQDFGDTSQSRSSSKGQVSSTIRGVFGSGATPNLTNTIDYVTIASTGNASDFGDTNGSLFEQAGCSDSHGGLS